MFAFCRAALVGMLSAFAVWQPHLLRAEDGFGTVKGEVRIDGKALAEGKILLHTEGAKPVEIPIKDGKYAADKVPTGKKTVTIEGTGVPAKYGSRETSSLVVEIKAGANELRFDLTTD